MRVEIVNSVEEAALSNSRVPLKKRIFSADPLQYLRPGTRGGQVPKLARDAAVVAAQSMNRSVLSIALEKCID
jgi:hypothetical protein